MLQLLMPWEPGFVMALQVILWKEIFEVVYRILFKLAKRIGFVLGVNEIFVQEDKRR